MDNFRAFVEIKVSQAIDNVFKQSHDWAKTNSGDITPEQKKKLDTLEKELVELVIAQTVQNIGTPKQEDTLEEPKEFSIDVCRTGWGTRTIKVMACSQSEAEEKALDEAGDHEFSEKDADYTIV